jgi:putative phosphonate metabolism protein
VHRYAIYFAPDRTHPLWTAGCRLLGRDPETGEAISQPDLAGVPRDRLAAITKDPRRYGWHATLKPPFALADGTDEAALVAALERFASQRGRFPMPGLALAPLSGFLALVPGERSPPLEALAADCVRAFDGFRRPPSAEETARRRRAGLDPEEERNLARWGYPYVMGRFRFHMTLTERLEPEERDRVAAALAPELAAALAVPLAADAVCLYGEPEQGAPFVLLRRFAFGGRGEAAPLMPGRTCGRTPRR